MFHKQPKDRHEPDRISIAQLPSLLPRLNGRSECIVDFARGTVVAGMGHFPIRDIRWHHRGAIPHAHHLQRAVPVSYTHLTLPTIYSV